MHEKELKDLIKLNKIEALTEIKEYFLVYLISLFKDENSDRRKTLAKELKEYLSNIKEENKYYNFLLKNITKIRSEESFQSLLDKMDLLNEKNYLYFENLLKEYEDDLTLQRQSPLATKKDFKTLLERNDLKAQAISLTTTFYDLMQYFSKNDAMYYLVPRTKFLEEATDFYGCFIKEDNSIIKEIRLCLPPIKDQKSLEECIYLYEIAIQMYHHLNSEFPKADYRLLAEQEVYKFKEKQLSLF